ncbi:MAG TPA: class I SAM-dependent methyltransferase [Actinophytocola sp.]|uniref:class I SAM-dependent methyltransferase n=1 Tax=Actinophytocola sp. TaxID=1872138 RepID=UPI002DBCF7D8|nr:class I SAM-dependent methyltransferase [Actinophytocola sp.]HEU5473600.1 class I SAM-dependent methyltransferase [Actinophytocola sp.]
MDEHNEVVRREFTRQAATFTPTGWAASGVDWILEAIRPAADEHVLEVAAGAGHLGRALAGRAAHVTALDLTPAVLQQGKRAADDAGQRNIVFQLGDAARLPYLDGSFDIVASRLSVHHFADPHGPVAEMVRVCRPTGRVALVDLVAVGPCRTRDRLERLRDPSHTRTHTLAELCALLDGAGATVLSKQTMDNPLRLTDWMDRTETPGPVRTEIEAALHAELSGGPETGLRPHLRDAELWFTHLWATILATPRPRS